MRSSRPDGSQRVFTSTRPCSTNPGGSVDWLASIYALERIRDSTATHRPCTVWAICRTVVMKRAWFSRLASRLRYGWGSARTERYRSSTSPRLEGSKASRSKSSESDLEDVLGKTACERHTRGDAA